MSLNYHLTLKEKVERLTKRREELIAKIMTMEFDPKYRGKSQVKFLKHNLEVTEYFLKIVLGK